MRSNAAQLRTDETVYVGIDLHRQRWHVTIRTEGVELFSASIPGTWEGLCLKSQGVLNNLRLEAGTRRAPRRLFVPTQRCHILFGSP
jgi:hypothetical protein